MKIKEIILKFFDQHLIYIKTKLFFSIKIVLKLKAKNNYFINWKALPENATSPHSGRNI